MTVGWSTVNGTAAAPGDLAASSGTLTFPAGTVAKTVAITVKADALAEAVEAYQLVLSAPSGATLADGIGAGSIHDDD